MLSTSMFGPLKRSVLVSALCLGLAAAASVSAGDVYKWKDANGVTHYSQTPPPKGSSQYRMFIHANREKAKTPESPVATQCATARSNVTLLESGKPLRRDTDGDGKPDADLDSKDRAQQLELARMVLRANCAGQSAQTAAKP
jgi:hypothetical protein